MSEAAVVNLFLTCRVLLVGGIIIVLPRITRKGLLFGAYVGEGTVDGDPARRLLVRWSAGCGILMVLSLLIGLGISVAGWPVPGNFTGTAVLLLGGGALYLRFHAKARELAPPGVAEHALKAVAPIGGEPTKTGFAKFVLIVCLMASLATFVYALVNQEAITDRSFVFVMAGPSFNVLLSPFLALFALLTATAKRSVRGGSGGGSVHAQEAFRATMTSIYTWTALLFCAFMTFMSVQIVRYGLSEIDSPGIGILVSAGIVVLFCLANLIRIMGKYGQGGAFLEKATVDAPLTNGLADNTHWVWGLFYVDKHDPSIVVESRFGIGYTFNYGRWTAILITGAFLPLCLALIILAVVKTFSGG